MSAARRRNGPKLWAALCLLAAPLLFAYSFGDTVFAGTNPSEAGPFPYAFADRVSYGLLGYTYWIEGQPFTGPHRHLTWVVGWLGLGTALLWRGRAGSEAARRMLRVSLLSLGLVVGVGGPVLEAAEARHNALRAQAELGGVVFASPATLRAEQCVRRPANSDDACPEWVRSVFPNPALWGVLGILLTGVVGLWPGQSVRAARPPTSE